ncbi:MAG: hypothetical protein MI741_21460, partial [Rhodospirillales bacterium]|nr:hypothetical protein [Rhodospirillales bacterium]
QIGGHEAVKGQVIEDINLGRAMKAAGAKIQIGMARQLLRCRMYDGWSDMWEGLTKNTYAGMEYKWWKLLGATAAVGLSTILAPVYLLAATGWLIASGGAALALLALTMSVSLLLLIARAGNAVRNVVELPSWYAWTMPLGALVFLSMTWASAWMYYRGGNVWKGRRYGNKERQSALRN